jgi:hypothetical protein
MTSYDAASTILCSYLLGSNPAVLFRCYPGPWQVLRRRRGGGPSGEDRLEAGAYTRPLLSST